MIIVIIGLLLAVVDAAKSSPIDEEELLEIILEGEEFNEDFSSKCVLILCFARVNALTEMSDLIRGKDEEIVLESTPATEDNGSDSTPHVDEE